MRNRHVRICLLSIVMLASCSSGRLTKNEATRLIKENKRYPLLIATDCGRFPRRSAIGQEMQRLEQEGYMTFLGNKATRGAPFNITDKGKNLLEQVYWNPFWGYEIIKPYTHTEDLASIDEILVDSNTNTAVVTYTVGNAPTEFYKRLRTIDPQNMPALQKPHSMKILLKKWDQGWRVLAE